MEPLVILLVVKIFLSDTMVNLQNLSSIKNELLSSKAELIAVSKTKSIAEILEVYNAGQRNFAENYVQEMKDKYDALPKDIKWHFIGHLQTNKIKEIAPFVTLIHGIDSIKILEETNKQARRNNRVINCLLQIYIAKEDTKFGLEFDEANSILEWLNSSNLNNIFIKGLMGMASNTTDVKQVKKEFKSLSTFYNSLKNKFGFSVLSMGMSGDYKIALSCGSNMVRIGSAIFGSRE